MPDHAQLLVKVVLQFAIARLVNAIKGHSSRILPKKIQLRRMQQPALGTNSWLVSTVVGAPLEVSMQQKRV